MLVGLGKRYRILWVVVAFLAAVPLFGDTPSGRFVQIEQEGNFATLPDDSRGTLFDVYRPVEIDDALIDRVVVAQHPMRRFLYGVRRRFFPGESPFDALSLDGKIRYTELLVEKRGGCKAGVPCDALERRPDAPEWLAKHPFFESPPGAPVGSPVSVRSPEITTDRDHPAAGPAEALKRHRWVIEHTGLESPHFHVFVWVPRDRLDAQREALLDWVQRENDDLFLASTRSNLANAMLPWIRPFDADTRARAEHILREGGTEPVRPVNTDPHDPKFTNLAIRYWGEKDGRVLVSLELRGLRSEYVYERKVKLVVRGFTEGEDVPKKVRSMAAIEAALNRLWVAAGHLEKGTLAAPPTVRRVTDVARADAVLDRLARERGVGRYLEYSDFLRTVYGQEPTPGLLFPFSDPTREPRAFAEGFLELSAEAARYRNPSEQARYLANQFWHLYDQWVQAEQRYLATAPVPARRRDCNGTLADLDGGPPVP